MNPFSTAGEMLAALRARQVSAVELLELHISRIEQFDGDINAVVIRDFDRARDAARLADERRAKGEDGALLGLPMTVKESFHVDGLPVSVGDTQFAGWKPDGNGLVVQRLIDAGAVILGKTNISIWLGDWVSDNPVYGRTLNPWDHNRTPGGSSGGSAAALAAGMTPLEIGSDIGGSIRVPAAFCGVYGHRPSDSALPRTGQMPVPGHLPNPTIWMGVQGPLARSAADLELAFDVTAGPDAGEDVAWRLEVPAARHERLQNFRVAVLPPVPWLPVDDELLASQEQLVGVLERAGVTVSVNQPEFFGNLEELMGLYYRLLITMITRGLPTEEKLAGAEEARKRGGMIGDAIADGLAATSGNYQAWFTERERFRAAYREFFREWDVLVCPNFSLPAFEHPDIGLEFRERHFTVNGTQIPYELPILYPAMATLCGQPSTAFPTGVGASGLPLGLQAIGPYLEDRTPIHFAELVAREIGGFQSPAGFGE